MLRLLICTLLLLPISLDAQDLATVTYAGTDANILNPERGFHHYTEYRQGSSPLTASTLTGVKNQGHTLIIRLYTITPFITGDISEAWLNVMRQDFQTLRTAGMKAIVKYRYSTAIGSPDAPLSQVQRHAEQIRPILHENADVILTVHAGFIGAWGEWHSSTNNLTTTPNRRAVLEAVLDAVPVDRQVNVRTPGYKRAIYIRTTPLTREEAHTGSDYARTAHHNDGFLASIDDLGTYSNVTIDKAYLEVDTRYVAMGGETGGSRTGTYYLCANAMNEMRRMHWTYINRGWYGPTIDSWIQDGCYNQIQNELGYRFVLEQGRYTRRASPGSAVRFELDLRNQGYAAPFNRRGFRILLRSTTDPAVMYIVDPPSDPRFWFGGETQNLAFDFGLPVTIPAGSYETQLFLPDPYPSIAHRPEYAIRLANAGLWDPSTGFNRLNHILVVDQEAEGTPYKGHHWFTAGTATSIDESGRTTADAFTLHNAYPNPFNPSTVLRFTLDTRRQTRLSVHDVLGREVAVLVDDVMSEGEHRVRFEAGYLPSGTYIIRLKSDEATKTSLITLIK